MAALCTVEPPYRSTPAELVPWRDGADARVDEEFVRQGDRAMRCSTRYSVLLVTLIVPAIMAVRLAQYVIETFFPDVTLIDPGAFHAMGIISGLATGIWWARSRRTEGQG